MGLYLLDSDAVIDYLAGTQPAVALLQELDNQQHVLCLCDVVIAEVYSGLTAEERTATLDLVSSCRFLNTTAEAAMMAGAWRYRYKRQGITLPATDALIAATAHTHRAVLLTGNLRHYPMPEVSLLPLLRDI